MSGISPVRDAQSADEGVHNVVSRSMAATTRRTIRRAVTWRPKKAGQQSLDIATLIAPFRYDVLVRAQLFDAIAGADPSPTDMADFVAHAATLPYAVWFREVELRRFFPWVLRDEALVSQAFAQRVERAVRTHHSFATRGYDPSWPIVLRRPSLPTRSDSGVVVDAPLHLGDGGHRLALLLRSTGTLEPAMYCIDTRPAPVIDNTAILVPALGLDVGAWARFVAPAFTRSPVDSYAGLHETLALSSPERVAELEVLAGAQHLLETCP